MFGFEKNAAYLWNFPTFGRNIYASFLRSILPISEAGLLRDVLLLVGPHMDQYSYLTSIRVSLI